MIKIALKHFIYEKCIDVLFNAIENNFCTNTENSEFKIGDTFEHITVALHDLPRGAPRKGLRIVMYDCTIVDNLQGTILVEHYSKCEEGVDSVTLDLYEDYFKPVEWRVNINDVVDYDRDLVYD